MSMDHKQRNFTILTTVIIMSLAISFGVFYSHRHTQQQSKLATVSTKTEVNTAPVAYLTIPNQQIRIPLIQGTTNLTVGNVQSSPYDTSDKALTILAPELDSNWECADASGTKGKATIGSISITTQSKRAGPGTPAVSKRIGNYTYGFEPAGEKCTKSTNYSVIVASFERQFSLIEAY
jgi:hypothetical protein